MSRVRRAITWFSELDTHRREELLFVLLLLLLAVLIIARRKFGQIAINVVDTYLSIVLTTALVSLYYRQATIQENQTEIMQFNREVREAELSPQLNLHIKSTRDGDLYGELMNRGKGPAVSISAVIERRGEDIESRLKLDDKDGFNLALLKPDERSDIHFTPKFPFKNSNGQILDLDLNEFRKRSESEPGEHFDLYLEYERLAGEKRETEFIYSGQIKHDLESTFNVK